MAGYHRKRAIQDEVHQNQFLREQYLRELRMQKLCTDYHVNPLRKVHTITKKPMSWHDNLEEPEDVRFLNLVHHAAQRPRKKYPETQTESQIGWEAEPLLPVRKVAAATAGRDSTVVIGLTSGGSPAKSKSCASAGPPGIQRSSRERWRPGA
ncbi:cilia- and flagella-associated protein 144-like [Marmota flaviventris]|uniref:cilia- and flagella-associated protein 144-like n=1 Tax=Marmota flaviventris TaxID=93162 RepID=UPI003A87F022